MERGEYQRVWQRGYNSGRRSIVVPEDEAFPLSALLARIADLPDAAFAEAWSSVGRAVYMAYHPSEQRDGAVAEIADEPMGPSRRNG